MEVEQAGATLGESLQTNAVRDSARPLERTDDEATVDLADDAGAFTRHGEHRALAQPDDVGPCLRVEAEVSEQADDGLLRIGDGKAILDRGAAPTLAEAGHVASHVAPLTRHMVSENPCESGILTRCRCGGTGLRGIPPARSAATRWRKTGAKGQTGSDEAVEVLARGVGVEPEVTGECGDALRLAHEGLEDPSPLGREGRERIRRAVPGWHRPPFLGIFHVSYRIKYCS